MGSVSVTKNANGCSITIFNGTDTVDVSMSKIKISYQGSTVLIWWANGGNAGNNGGVSYPASEFITPSGSAQAIAAAIEALLVPI